MSMSHHSLHAPFARVSAIASIDDPDLDLAPAEPEPGSLPNLLLTDDQDDAFWFTGDAEQLTNFAERIYTATAAAFPEQSRMRFIYPGTPHPVCPCGNGDPARPEPTERPGFYLGDDAGVFAGRLGDYTTIVCRTCGRAGTFPLGHVPIAAAMGDDPTPRPRTLPGFGFIVAHVDAETIADADEQSLAVGNWKG